MPQAWHRSLPHVLTFGSSPHTCSSPPVPRTKSRLFAAPDADSTMTDVVPGLSDGLRRTVPPTQEPGLACVTGLGWGTVMTSLPPGGRGPWTVKTAAGHLPQFRCGVEAHPESRAWRAAGRCPRSPGRDRYKCSGVDWMLGLHRGQQEKAEDSAPGRGVSSAARDTSLSRPAAMGRDRDAGARSWKMLGAA